LGGGGGAAPAAPSKYAHVQMWTTSSSSLKRYIRPRLKYCIQLRSLYLTNDTASLEKVQRAAADMVPQL